MRVVSATDAAKGFRELLDAVEHRGESFRIERHGRSVALVSPDQGLRRGPTWAQALAMLVEGPRADPEFADDMEAVRRSMGPMPSDPWESSSTPLS
jgi:antitoxin (DNA-binding transcriptional repressor) of toxin-antitoxin stability system